MMNQPAFRAGLRPDRAVLQVKGEDARHFLHNLVTADIEGLQSGQSRYAALLTPQGKIRFDMFICDAGDRFLIDCAAAKSAELLKLLGFYKLRAKVTVEPIELKVVASPEEPDAVLRFADPRYAAMGWRALVPAASAASMAEAEGYDAARIANGLADSMADLASGDVFPHEANLDQLGGVSFSKGCYVGQEVVSRMEHRGTARSRILPVRFESGTASGTGEIRANDKVVGQLLSSADGRALALLRLDRLAEAQGPLLTETGSIMVEKPAWVRYDVPGVST